MTLKNAPPLAEPDAVQEHIVHATALSVPPRSEMLVEVHQIAALICYPATAVPATSSSSMQCRTATGTATASAATCGTYGGSSHEGIAG